MTDGKSDYIDWVRDAHAMEEQALTMLKGQAGRIENYPELSARIQQHIRETEEQIRMLDGVLTRLNDDSSFFKDAAGKLTATMQAMGGVFASDEVIKGVLASYTFEHMEAESYRILIAAAEAVGDHQSVPVYESILRQEEEMARWLSDHSAELTRAYLERRRVGVAAKV